MIAILKDAVECLDKYRDAKSAVGRCLYQDAIEWVQDRDTNWLFSFTNICDLLGFDPQYMREVLLKRESKFSKAPRRRMLSFDPLTART
jgi:hypothetical protein